MKNQETTEDTEKARKDTESLFRCFRYPSVSSVMSLLLGYPLVKEWLLRFDPVAAVFLGFVEGAVGPSQEGFGVVALTVGCYPD